MYIVNLKFACLTCPIVCKKLEIDHVDFIYCNAVNNLYLAAVHHTLVLKGYYKVTKNLTVTNSDRKSMPSTSCIILSFFYQDIPLRVRLEVISIQVIRIYISIGNIHYTFINIIW